MTSLTAPSPPPADLPLSPPELELAVEDEDPSLKDVPLLEEEPPPLPLSELSSLAEAIRQSSSPRLAIPMPTLRTIRLPSFQSVTCSELSCMMRNPATRSPSLMQTS